MFHIQLAFLLTSLSALAALPGAEERRRLQLKKVEKKKGSPDEICSPRLPRDPPPLGQLLDESGIKRGGGGNHGISGFTDTCPVLLYIPGETSQQAKESLDRYRNQIDDILSHQYCPFKVRPVVVGKHKYSLLG